MAFVSTQTYMVSRPYKNHGSFHAKSVNVGKATNWVGDTK